MNEQLRTPRSARTWIGASLFPLILSVLLLAEMAEMPAAAAGASGNRDAKASASESKRGASDADSKKSRDKAKSGDKTGAGDEEAGEELFMKEGKENQKFLPDIFRCPECGYEQDEPGFCPDHDESALVLVRSKGKNPLEPSEVDGNEDIVVDIPLTGLSLKKAATATGTAGIVSAPRPAGGQKAEEATQGR